MSISRFIGPEQQLDNLTNLDILVSRGNVPGVSDVRQIGTRVVGTTFSDVWNGTSATIPKPTVARTVRIRAGGNVNDDVIGGSGARLVRITGLDENFDIATADVETNGIGASGSTVNTFIRVYDARVIQVGTYGGANTGDIIIEDSAGTEVIKIEAGVSQSEIARYSIPRNKTLFLSRFKTSIDASIDGDIRMWTRENIDDITAPFTSVSRIVQRLEGAAGSIAELTFRIPIKVVGPGDIWVDAKVSNGTGLVEVDLTGYLIND